MDAAKMEVTEPRVTIG